MKAIKLKNSRLSVVVDDCDYNKCVNFSDWYGWQAYITKNYESIYIGIYNTKEEAAKARDKKALELFGKYAKLNFPI